MGSHPSTQVDPEVVSQWTLLKAYYQDQAFKKYELNKLKIKNIYISSNPSYKDLREAKSIQKSAQHTLQEMNSSKETLNLNHKHLRTVSHPIDLSQIELLSLTLDSMSESISTDLTYQSKKTQHLQEKLKSLQETLAKQQNTMKKNVNTLKGVIDKKLKVSHKKAFSEKFTDSTFFTSNTGFNQNSTLNLKQISGALNEIRGLSELKPAVLDLKQKVLLRNEMKQALDIYYNEYSRKLKKIKEMKEKLEKSPADEIYDAKFTESELKILRNKIFILEKEIENDRNEHVFLMNISVIGKKFSDFQSKLIHEQETVY